MFEPVTEASDRSETGSGLRVARPRPLETGVRVLACALAARSLDDALRDVAALLERELGCGPVHGFRVGQASRAAIEPRAALRRVTVSRDGQPVAGLELRGVSETVTDADLTSLLELTRLALCDCAQREPARPVDAAPALDRDILVVEDNGVNRQLMEQMLEGVGCRVQMTSGALEGLRALCEKRFDLVLMDIQMPGMDGVEALRWFRRGPGSRFAFVTPPHTPVVAVTANALAGDETRLRGLGFDDYLSKPLRRNRLLAMLKQHLNPALAAAPGALDAAALERLCELDPKGENQLLQRVLTAFESSLARLIPALRDASAAGDLTGVRHVAHTLKSSSASIGALKLSQMCGEMESMIRLDQVESLNARVEAMCSEVEGVLQALRRLLDGKE